MYISPPSVICPFGDENALFNALLEGKRALKLKRFINREFLVASIEFKLDNFGKNTSEKYKTRTNQILLTALNGLKDELKKAFVIYDKARVGVVIGTTTTGVEENLAAFKDESFCAHKFSLSKNALANAAEFVREFLGLKSVALGVSTACTSGIKAFESAINLINLGICDAVICGGVDSLSSLSVLGFNSLSVLSNAPAKPFDINRDGINIGEAAAVFVLYRDKISPFFIKAISSNCDAYHITQPDPSATQQIALIKELLKMANLSEVEYISLHGTGTLANDLMEAKACYEVLPNALASGVKANIGHTLGAAGAINMAVCLSAMSKKIVPKQILNKIDPNLAPLNLALKNESKSIKNCLNLSFAFGGDNAGAIVGMDE